MFIANNFVYKKMYIFELYRKVFMAKKIGVLAPVSILPGSHGIGDFGSVSFEFIDVLANNNISVWQVLPLNPLGYGNSPYQPYSSYAGEELYISLDELKQLGLLSDIKNYDLNNNVTEYEKVRIFKNESDVRIKIL